MREQAKPMRLALAEGRFKSFTQKIIERLGFSSQPKQLRYHSSDSPIEITILKAPDIPHLLRLGLFDLGIAPDEWIMEWNLARSQRTPMPFDLEPMFQIPVVRVRISLLSSIDQPKSDVRDRVATPFINISRRYFESKNRYAELVVVRGSTEGLVPDPCRLAIDCVETGSAVSVNRLLETEIIADNLGLSLVRSSVRAGGAADLNCQERILGDAIQEAIQSFKTPDQTKNNLV